jgi:predicted nucleic acid-binding protein
MIYLDSCLVIYLLEEPQARGALIRAEMGRHADEEFATSWLVHLECLVRPFATGDVPAARGYQQLLDQFVAVPLDRDVFVQAARLRADSRLRTPDAIHLAAAQTGGCVALWTNDERLARAAGDFAVNVVSG